MDNEFFIYYFLLLLICEIKDFYIFNVCVPFLIFLFSPALSCLSSGQSDPHPGRPGQAHQARQHRARHQYRECCRW